MRMSFRCGYCHGTLAADPRRAGSAVTCPRCRATIEVPAPPAPEPEVPEAELVMPAPPPRRAAVREQPAREPEPPRRPKRKTSPRPIRRSRPSGNATRTAVLLVGLAVIIGGASLGLLLLPGRDAKQGGVARSGGGEKSEERNEFGRAERDAEVNRPADPPPVDIVPFLPHVVPPVPPASERPQPGLVAVPPGGNPLDAIVPKLGPPAGWQRLALERMTVAIPADMKQVGGPPPRAAQGGIFRSGGLDILLGVTRYYPADKPFPPGGEAAGFRHLPAGQLIERSPKITVDGYPGREYRSEGPGGISVLVFCALVDGEFYTVGVNARQLADYDAQIKTLRDSIRFKPLSK